MGLREEIGPCNQYVPVQTVSGIVSIIYKKNCFFFIYNICKTVFVCIGSPEAQISVFGGLRREIFRFQLRAKGAVDRLDLVHDLWGANPE